MTKGQEWAEKWVEDFYRKFVQQPEAANKEQRRKALDEWVDQNLENVASFYKTMVAFIDEKEAESWAKTHKNELSLGKEGLSEILQANLDKEQLKAALEHQSSYTQRRSRLLL